MGGSLVNDHDIDMYAHLLVRPVPGGQTHALLLSRHTHTEKENWGRRLSLSAIEHITQEREICRVSETTIEIDGRKLF